MAQVPSDDGSGAVRSELHLVQYKRVPEGTTTSTMCWQVLRNCLDHMLP